MGCACSDEDVDGVELPPILSPSERQRRLARLELELASRVGVTKRAAEKEEREFDERLESMLANPTETETQAKRLAEQALGLARFKYFDAEIHLRTVRIALSLGESLEITERVNTEMDALIDSDVFKKARALQLDFIKAQQSVANAFRNIESRILVANGASAP